MVQAAVSTKYAFDLQPGDVYWCTADCGTLLSQFESSSSAVRSVNEQRGQLTESTKQSGDTIFCHTMFIYVSRDYGICHLQFP